MKAISAILEIEIGVVGGEEDGVANEINDKLYSTVEDGLATAAALGLGEKGRYMTALTFGNVHGVYKPGNVKLRPELLGEIQAEIAKSHGTGEKGRYLTALTFGNVHGVYKPGNVKLRPEILKNAQDAVIEELGLDAGARPFDLVFHGGSGSTAEEISAAVDYGVIKMNVDTDTQYAFTRPVAAHMFANYDGVLKVDGEVGNKKQYDPRSWGKTAETAMAARVVEAAKILGSAGHTRG